MKFSNWTHTRKERAEEHASTGVTQGTRKEETYVRGSQFLRHFTPSSTLADVRSTHGLLLVRKVFLLSFPH